MPIVPKTAPAGQKLKEFGDWVQSKTPDITGWAQQAFPKGQNPIELPPDVMGIGQRINQMAEPLNVGVRGAYSVARGTAGTAQGLMQPQNLALLGGLKFARFLPTSIQHRLLPYLNAGFSAEMLNSAWDQVPEMRQAFYEGRWEDGIEQLTGIAQQGAMGIGAAKGAVTSGASAMQAGEFGVPGEAAFRLRMARQSAAGPRDVMETTPKEAKVTIPRVITVNQDTVGTQPLLPSVKKTTRTLVNPTTGKKEKVTVYPMEMVRAKPVPPLKKAIRETVKMTPSEALEFVMKERAEGRDLGVGKTPLDLEIDPRQRNMTPQDLDILANLKRMLPNSKVNWRFPRNYDRTGPTLEEPYAEGEGWNSMVEFLNANYGMKATPSGMFDVVVHDDARQYTGDLREKDSLGAAIGPPGPSAAERAAVDQIKKSVFVEEPPPEPVAEPIAKEMPEAAATSGGVRDLLIERLTAITQAVKAGVPVSILERLIPEAVKEVMQQQPAPPAPTPPTPKPGKPTPSAPAVAVEQQPTAQAGSLTTPPAPPGAGLTWGNRLSADATPEQMKAFYQSMGPYVAAAGKVVKIAGENYRIDSASPTKRWSEPMNKEIEDHSRLNVSLTRLRDGSAIDQVVDGKSFRAKHGIKETPEMTGTTELGAPQGKPADLKQLKVGDWVKFQGPHGTTRHQVGKVTTNPDGSIDMEFVTSPKNIARSTRAEPLTREPEEGGGLPSKHIRPGEMMVSPTGEYIVGTRALGVVPLDESGLPVERGTADTTPVTRDINQQLRRTAGPVKYTSSGKKPSQKPPAKERAAEKTQAEKDAAALAAHQSNLWKKNEKVLNKLLGGHPLPPSPTDTKALLQSHLNDIQQRLNAHNIAPGAAGRQPIQPAELERLLKLQKDFNEALTIVSDVLASTPGAPKGGKGKRIRETSLGIPANQGATMAQEAGRTVEALGPGVARLNQLSQEIAQLQGSLGPTPKQLEQHKARVARISAIPPEKRTADQAKILAAGPPRGEPSRRLKALREELATLMNNVSSAIEQAGTADVGAARAALEQAARLQAQSSKPGEGAGVAPDVPRRDALDDLMDAWTHEGETAGQSRLLSLQSRRREWIEKASNLEVNSLEHRTALATIRALNEEILKISPTSTRNPVSPGPRPPSPPPKEKK